MQQRSPYVFEKIKENRRQEQASHDAPVYIDDYIATATDRKLSYGEHGIEAKDVRANPEDRLFLHIESLAKFVNLAHAINHCELKMSRYKAIKSIGESTDLFEEKYRCDVTYDRDVVIRNAYIIKEDHLNHISRISSPEFSLFPAIKPLTLDEYSQLVSKINQLASQLLDNVHLVISSLPVISPDSKRLLNMNLYVRCGKEPVINEFNKANASRIDKKYDNLINFSQLNNGAKVYLMALPNPKIGDSYKRSDKQHLYLYKGSNQKVFYFTENSDKKYYFEKNGKLLIQFPDDAEFNSSRDNLIEYKNELITSAICRLTKKRKHTRDGNHDHKNSVCPYIADSKGNIMSSQSAITWETIGGIRSITFVDTCRDYHYDHSRQLLCHMLDAPLNNSYLIPDNVDHLLSSNIISKNNAHNISQHLTHIDPKYTLKNNKIVGKIDLDPNMPFIQHYLDYNKNEPLLIFLNNNGNGFNVDDPIFGHDYYIYPIERRTLDRLSKTEFASSFKLRNENAIQMIARELTGTNDEQIHADVEAAFNRLKAKKISTLLTRNMVLNKSNKADQLINCFIILKKLSLLTDKNILLVSEEIHENTRSWLNVFERFLSLHSKKIKDIPYFLEQFLTLIQAISRQRFLDHTHLMMLFSMKPLDTITTICYLHRYTQSNNLNKIIFSSLCEYENPKHRSIMNQCFNELDNYNLLTEANCQLLKKINFNMKIIDELLQLEKTLCKFIENHEIKLDILKQTYSSSNLFKEGPLRAQYENYIALGNAIKTRLHASHDSLPADLVMLLEEEPCNAIYNAHKNILMMMNLLTPPEPEPKPNSRLHLF